MLVSHSKSIFGYDTRSLRSALVMHAVDALNPFKRTRYFEWRGPVVVSSISGLGDLFIHLPLISGIVSACRERELKVRVALRPAHARIVRRCGWDVMPFDHGLEDFFKNPAAFRFSDFVRTIRAARKKQAPALWIDLTGNAIGAVAIKASGAQRLAARITRGGRSLVDHPLPHLVQENEYENRNRVANYLGCDVDLTLAERFVARAPELSNSVVLCLTTASQWKNWPLANFRSLIERFPETPFTTIGFRREVMTEELDELEKISQQPRVANRLDQLSAEQVVDLIAHCRAIITNDTSAAHIANFFGKPGAVLFGPVNPKTFAAPNGLVVFHDATCPFHPCVQWRCDNQANWCMRKINVHDVAAHLAHILGFSARSISSSPPEPAHGAAHEPDWQR
jgi:ADP-heptose:LPS heptosyltransferase